MKISLEKKHKDNIKYMLDKKSILNFLKKTINHEDILLIKGSNSAMTNDLANFFLKKEINNCLIILQLNLPIFLFI